MTIRMTIWMSNIKEGRYKLRLQVFVNLLTGVYAALYATPSPWYLRAQEQYR